MIDDDGNDDDEEEEKVIDNDIDNDSLSLTGGRWVVNSGR